MVVLPQDYHPTYLYHDYNYCIDVLYIHLLCDCCGVDSKDLKGEKLHLDHCHTTSDYRGHLCSSCNRGIGMLGDNLEGVQQAVDYLKKVENK